MAHGMWGWTRRVGMVVVGLAVIGGFPAAAQAVVNPPDLQTIIPTNSFSIVNNAGAREFRYTHLVYNAGPGPLEIQPSYSQTSGNYTGTQQIFQRDTSGAWSVASNIRVPDPFVFHAAHGHFHFPLASFGLYRVAADGGVGTPVTMSPKNGFCIDDSYMYSTSIPNAGTFIGNKGSCGDPTTLRGLTVGAVDEYDYRDPGQAIPFDGVPDGTYWFRAVSDPNNDLVEADESNNETDVKVTIANGVVAPGQVTHPDTTPPAVAWTAPALGTTITGDTTFSATSSVPDAAGVQFLSDGAPLGTASGLAGSFSFLCHTQNLVDGEHWFAARATDSLGRINTTAAVPLSVSNTPVGPPPPPPPPDGPLALDASVSQTGSGTVTSPTLTPTHGNDVILALVASDGASSGQTTTIAGGGLFWSLVRRVNTQAGTSEIWKAQGPATPTGFTVRSTQSQSGYDQMLSVFAFSGSSGVGASAGLGASSGAPSVGLTTTGAGSWVFGVGNDWDRAVARTVGTGQDKRFEWVDNGAGDTFWTQSRSAPTANSGTSVTINDTAPTGDRWNLAAVEVLAGAAGPPPPPPPPPPVDLTNPVVSVTDPVANTTIKGIVALGATASDANGVTKVQFKVDGQPVGAAITAPPFLGQWDTRSATAGTHVVTAEATDPSGNVGVSQPVSVTVDNSGPAPGIITIDKKLVRHAKGPLTSPALTTAASGEQIFAFVSYDGPSGAQQQRSTVTGAGLTWTLVKRSDSQSGVSEIWNAKAAGTLTNATVTATPLRAGFDGSLTVIAFRGALGPGVAGASGAPSGAPDIYLPGVQTASWVFAAGNDWDGSSARTPVANQLLQDQWLDTGTGDTFWVQSTTAPLAAPGLVTIHDSSPVNHQWNYVAVEVVAAPGV